MPPSLLNLDIYKKNLDIYKKNLDIYKEIDIYERAVKMFC